MDRFEIVVACADDHLVRLEVNGEVDMSTGPQLLDAVVSAALVHERHHIVVDLRNVTFLDCSGLRLLYRARGRVLDQGGHLHLVCTHPLTLRILLQGYTTVLRLRWMALCGKL